MPNYTPKLLKYLNYKPNKNPQNSPHEHFPITCNKKRSQQMINLNKFKEIISSATKHMQSIARSFLHDYMSLNSTILIVLNDIGTTQDNHT